MRTRLSKTPLPRDWSGHPHNRAVFEADITVDTRSRLRVKLLVFRCTRDLNRFWSGGLKRCRLDRDCLGATANLGCSVTSFNKDGTESHFKEFDPRYVAIVGLLTKHLTCEVLSHESVHVGFAWAWRFGNHRWPDSWHEEEKICYPTGRFFAEAVHVLRNAGLLK